ncbi:MAG: molybdopterin-dependent oxidoreductase [Alicyclobacillus sp.]|nr:molybdopterin-dependent oxidoreductase [Alicyclobacillus sp.]
MSGMALYLPAVHAPLIPYLRLLYDAHIVIGLVFAGTLLAPLLRRLLPEGKTILRPDWLIPTVFGAAIVVTGILLWGVRVFPTVWRAPAFWWHGALTTVLSAWLVTHAFLKALGVRFPRDTWAGGRIQPERRAFLRWLAGGTAVAAVVTVLDPLRILRALARPTGQASAAATPSNQLPDFPEYYTVVRPPYPVMKLTDYRLTVDGSVAHPAVLTWQDIQQLTFATETVDFHCVTGWSVPNVRWHGFTIQSLVNRVQPQGHVKYVHFYSFDGAYSECLQLAEALDPSVLLATTINNQPLPVVQGFPVRLVVPKMYGYKSIKWVNRVVFSERPIEGFWEQRGYPTEAYWS